MIGLRRVLVFGTFDPWHEGHDFFLRQARALGDKLIVVVARDSNIKERKNREPGENEEVRRQKVDACPSADEVLLGDEWPVEDPYALLIRLDYEILALGYDQQPREDEIRQYLDSHSKKTVTIVRLGAFYPERNKSSLLRRR